MAKAPRPGAQREANEATTTVRVTINGDTRELQPNSVPLGIRTQFRKAHGGIPFEQYLPEEVIGLDSLAALWWVAGLVAGVTNESAQDALDLIESVGDVESIGVEVINGDQIEDPDPS